MEKTSDVNTARFVFDPLHRPEGTPSLATMRTWALSRMVAAEGPLGDAVRSTARILPSDTLLTMIGDLLPGGRARRFERGRRACIEHVMRHVDRCHESIREFGLDPRDHPIITERMERTLALSCFLVQEDVVHRMIEGQDHDVTSSILKETMDEVDVTGRIEKGHAGIREILEIEAVSNIVNSSDDPKDRPRIIAGLKASLDEIVDPEMRSFMTDALTRIDGNASPA